MKLNRQELLHWKPNKGKKMSHPVETKEKC